MKYKCDPNIFPSDCSSCSSESGPFNATGWFIARAIGPNEWNVISSSCSSSHKIYEVTEATPIIGLCKRFKCIDR